MTKFRDFLWVLQAFLRGKVLRQKAYRPQGNLFRVMPGATVKRMIMIMRWWGFRPATLEELMALTNQETKRAYDNVPYVSWIGNKPELRWSWNDRADAYHFVALRREP